MSLGVGVHLSNVVFVFLLCLMIVWLWLPPALKWVALTFKGRVQVIPSRNIKPRCNCGDLSDIFDVWNPGVTKVCCEIIARGRHRILMLIQHVMMGEAQENMSISFPNKNVLKLRKIDPVIQRLGMSATKKSIIFLRKKCYSTLIIIINVSWANQHIRMIYFKLYNNISKYNFLLYFCIGEHKILLPKTL